MDILVLAAGMASRYGGLKQLEPVGRHGEVLLDYGIYDAVRSGCDRVVFVIRKDIESDFRSRVFDRIAAHVDCEYVFQDKTSRLPKSLFHLAQDRQKPYGTVQALLCAEDKIKSDFIIINSDDYYGASSYGMLCDHFKTSAKSALVGYQLDKTLLGGGRVNRGVGVFDSAGRLTGIEETYDIGVESGVVVGRTRTRNRVNMTGKEMASMNLFGFPHSVFPLLNEYWAKFTDRLRIDNSKECVLSVFCDEKLTEGEIEFECYRAKDEWFGMTYKEDTPLVRAKIAKYIQQGVYPDCLWE